MQFFLFFKLSQCKTATARNLINSVPQTSAKTFAFSSIFILILYNLMLLNIQINFCFMNSCKNVKLALSLLISYCRMTYYYDKKHPKKSIMSHLSWISPLDIEVLSSKGTDLVGEGGGREQIWRGGGGAFQGYTVGNNFLSCGNYTIVILFFRLHNSLHFWRRRPYD